MPNARIDRERPTQMKADLRQSQTAEENISLEAHALPPKSNRLLPRSCRCLIFLVSTARHDLQRIIR
jgi:hypothetical protein